MALRSYLSVCGGQLRWARLMRRLDAMKREMKSSEGMESEQGSEVACCCPKAGWEQWVVESTLGCNIGEGIG